LILTTNKLFSTIINYENIDLNKYSKVLNSAEEIFLYGRKTKIIIGSVAKKIANVCYDDMFDNYLKYDEIPTDNILMWAIITNRKNITRLLIESCENLSKIKNKLLCVAVRDGSMSMLKFLVEIMKINFDDIVGSINNPLEQASMRGHLIMFEYLFQYDKNVETHCRALFTAVEKGHINIVKFLINNGCIGDKNKILNMADERKYSNIIEFLINDHFVDINKSKIFNLAVKYGFLNIVQKMIVDDYPVDINKDKILNIAINNNSESVVEYLLNKYY